MGNNIPQANRDTFFDTYKYLLIILVITGHFLEGYKHLHTWMEYVYSFIYLFHMPFFVFVSGYFSKRVTSKKLLKSSFLLMETFILLQTGFLWLRNEEWPDWNAVFSPWYAPWYLISLIWWRWIAFFCLKINKPAICLGIAVIIGIGSGFLNGSAELTSFLALARTCVFLPFFMAGLYITPLQIRRLRNTRHQPFILLLMVIAVSLIFFSGMKLNIIEYGNGFHWNEKSIGESFRLFGIRLYFLGSATALIICCLNLLPALKACAGFGRRTMFFFSYHIFFLLFFHYYLRREWHIAHPDWWYPSICIVLTVIILNSLSRITFFTRMLNPVSSLIIFCKNRLKR